VDLSFRTPLLDFFRRGDVARDIRLLAAQGALAPRAHEQLGLLVFLVEDPDPDIRRAAEQTIGLIPQESLSAFLGRSDVAAELRAFFATRGIEPAAVPAPDAGGPLIGGDESDESGADGHEPEEADGHGPEEKVSTLQRIAALTVAQRVALAMKGSREERTILIRDSNKLVAVAVLSSPKVTESEIESIAKMSSISDEVLRIIANTRAWVKSYAVTLALAKNPKTPVAISMNLLARLQDKDLRMLSTDRNVAEILRITARQKLVITK